MTTWNDVASEAISVICFVLLIAVIVTGRWPWEKDK